MNRLESFEGEVTQHLPEGKSGFVKLSRPVGEIQRAFFSRRINDQAPEPFKYKDAVTGTMLVGDAVIAEVKAMEKIPN